jgi:hypothetical protein|tara:strand:- start:138 stop:2360 length:2223 start_codon:yes stop_codon:yes gene_type:complete
MAKIGSIVVGKNFRTGQDTAFVVNFNLPNNERIQQNFAFSLYGGRANAKKAAEKFYNKTLKNPKVKALAGFATKTRREDVVKSFLNYLDKNNEFDGNEKLAKELVKYKSSDGRFEQINKSFKEWKEGKFDVDGIDNKKARSLVEVKNWSPKARGDRTQVKETQLRFLDNLNNDTKLNVKQVESKFDKAFKKGKYFTPALFGHRVNQLTQLKRNGSVSTNADGSSTRSYGIKVGERAPWLKKALSQSISFNTNYNRLIRAGDILKEKGEINRANRLYKAADNFFGTGGIFTKLPGNAEHPLSVIYGKAEDILKVDSLVKGDLNLFKKAAFDAPIKRLAAEYNKPNTSVIRKEEIKTLMNNRKSFLNYLTSGSVDKGIVEKVNFDFTPKKVSLTASVTPVDKLGKSFDFSKFVEKGKGYSDVFSKRGAGGNLLTAEGFAKRTGVSDVRIANLLKAVENAPSGCQKILQFKTGGISATCAEAIIKDPVGSATKLQELKPTSAALGKVKNAATAVLKFAGKGKTFAVTAGVGALGGALVKQFRNDDPTTYLTNDKQANALLLDTADQLEREERQAQVGDAPELLDEANMAANLGVTAAAVPGSKKLFDARKKKGFGAVRAGLGPVGKALSGFATPLGIAATTPLNVASQVYAGDSVEDIVTDPLNYLGPAFAGSLTKEATRGMSPTSTLSKALRLGMNPATIRTASKFFGLPGLALSLGYEGYDQYKKYTEGRGLVYDLLNKNE